MAYLSPFLTSLSFTGRAAGTLEADGTRTIVSCGEIILTLSFLTPLAINSSRFRIITVL